MIRALLCYLFVCPFLGHDWHFGGNPWARAAGAERCDRSGIFWRFR